MSLQSATALPATACCVQEVLNKRFDQAQSIERQMHDIAQIHRTMAVELSAQMEQAEKLYTDAVIATEHLHRGNVQLKKTVAVKKGSGWYMFIVLVAAGIGLLLADALFPG